MRNQVKDITGQRFGRLIAIKRVDNTCTGQVCWLCRCDCGNKTTVRSNGLCSGNTKSCGCLQKDIFSQEKGSKNRNWKGGITSDNNKMRSSLEYREWRLAVFRRDNFRCQNPKCMHKCRILNAHHILPLAEYPVHRLDISNGITLCRDCHKEVHKKDARLRI